MCVFVLFQCFSVCIFVFLPVLSLCFSLFACVSSVSVYGLLFVFIVGFHPLISYARSDILFSLLFRELLSLLALTYQGAHAKY